MPLSSPSAGAGAASRTTNYSSKLFDCRTTYCTYYYILHHNAATSDTVYTRCSCLNIQLNYLTLIYNLTQFSLYGTSKTDRIRVFWNQVCKCELPTSIRLWKVIVWQKCRQTRQITRGHFLSSDKDGGHTIRSVVVENPMYTQTWWLFIL